MVHNTFDCSYRQAREKERVRGVASIEAEEALASSVFSDLMNNLSRNSPLISTRAPATTLKR